MQSPVRCVAGKCLIRQGNVENVIQKTQGDGVE